MHWTYVICRIKGLSVRGDIACKPKKANDTGKYKVKVTFDSNTEVDSNKQFEYLSDPVIKSTEPAELKSISRYVFKIWKNWTAISKFVVKLYGIFSFKTDYPVNYLS